MNRQYIHDHQVIERYLRGALTPDEEQAFEEAYLGDPEILDELQAAERLREGVKELDAAGRLKRARPQPRWLQALVSPQYAAAASVLLAVSVVLSTTLYRENQSLREQSVSMNSLARVVVLESVRGGNASEIPAPAEDELIVLRLDAGLADYDTYRAVLVRSGGDELEAIWSRADVQPVDGWIQIGLPGRALRPGSYEARVEGRMADWPAERFDEVTRTQLTVLPRD
jgi:hypothetical protein